MWKSILTTTIIAGCLDITAACMNAYLSSGVTPDRLLKYIASGLYGKSASTGGFDMMLLGLLVHFIIAFSCTACYFWAYPKLSFLKQNVWLNSALIAIAAWVVTTRVIVPMSQIQQPPFNLIQALKAVTILYFCIGLPISFAAKKALKG